VLTRKDRKKTLGKKKGRATGLAYDAAGPSDRLRAQFPFRLILDRFYGYDSPVAYQNMALSDLDIP